MAIQQTSSRSPPSQKIPVGTGAKGGVIVLDPKTGKTEEVQASIQGELPDVGRKRFVSGGGSGTPTNKPIEVKVEAPKQTTPIEVKQVEQQKSRFQQAREFNRIARIAGAKTEVQRFKLAQDLRNNPQEVYARNPALDPNRFSSQEISKPSSTTGTRDYLPPINRSVQQPIEKKSILDKAEGYLEKSGEARRQRVATKDYNVGTFTKDFVTGVATGVGSSILGTARLISNPNKAAEGFVSNVINNPQFTKQLYFNVKADPSKALGEFATTIYGPKVVKEGTIKGIDVARTIGKSELPVREIVAPEYFAGQRFPEIRKGQTVGELLQEFKPQLPDETKPAGFTASRIPFKGETVARKGSSEFFGLYQAPKLSPIFLRISGESRKTFGLNPFGTLRPTVQRVTPTAYELPKGVNPSQSNLNPLNTELVRKFGGGEIPVKRTDIPKLSVAFTEKEIKFIKDHPKAKDKVMVRVETGEPTLERGKAYVTFIKTEKEAIIPFGTPLIQTGKRFYFEFEGRRVPIQEYKALSLEQERALTKSAASSSTKITTAGKSASSSYRPLRSEPLTSPLDVIRLRSSSRSPSSSSSSYIRSSILSSPRSSSISSYSRSPSSTSSISSSSSSSIVAPSPYNPLSSSSSTSLSSSSSSPSSSSLSSSSNIISSTSITRPESSLSSAIRKLRESGATAFDVFIKRKGKYVKVEDDLPLNRALKKGAEITKSTLAARFKIVPDTKAVAKQRDISYTVDPKVFRDYQIKKGNRLPLGFGEFIEKRGQRLARRSEVSEIQSFKRSRPKTKKMGMFGI